MEINRLDLVIADVLNVYRKSALVERCLGDVLLVLAKGPSHHCMEYENDEYMFLAKSVLDKAYERMIELDDVKAENERLRERLKKKDGKV